MKHKHIITPIVVGFLLITALSVFAEEPRGHEGAREHREEGTREHHAEEIRNHHEAVRLREHHAFAARDFHHFNRVERDLWIGGRWNNTCFAGRCGWWWFAEGQWYFYGSRVGPYPLVVSEITYIEPYPEAPVVVAPQAPVVVAPQAPVVAAPQAPAQPQPVVQTWYYCESSKTYYPYVANCPEGWKSVPAQPSPPAPR